MVLENLSRLGQSELMRAEGNDFIEGETSKERESNTSNPVEPYVLTIVLFVVAVAAIVAATSWLFNCLLYTSPSPRDATLSRMPSSA